METFTQPKIVGYRQLNETEAAAMNEVKALAAQCGDLVARLSADGTLDHRWIAIGRTELQQGFMALTRAIAQPTTF